MQNKVLTFSQFNNINEGGSAIKTSRRIREDEFESTLSSIKDKLFPVLGIDPAKPGDEYIVIGSIGKKKNPDDTSGDLDIGYDAEQFSLSNGITKKECSAFVNQKMEENLETILGFKPEIKYMKGLNIVSIGWPIGGDEKNGMVQLDLIPLTSIEWADFIYYSPDYKMDESKYKSAHRNWLLAAILSERKEVLERDEDGEIMDYDTPVLILSDGLFWHKKSYRGKIKPRLKTPTKIEGSERFVTSDPQEFIDFALGRGYTVNDVKTFENVLGIIESPAFDLVEHLPEIKQRFINYLERAGLEIPAEVNEIA
jgi:hypothetical protein